MHTAVWVVSMKRSLPSSVRPAFLPTTQPFFIRWPAVTSKWDRLEHARNAYRRSVTLAPDDEKVLHLLGNAAKELADYEEAADCYRRAVVINPQFAAAWYELGNTCKHQNRLDEAGACYRKALEITPDDPGALVCLGNVLKSQEELTQAADCYRRLLTNRPDQPVWDLWIAGLCPAVFADYASIDAYRAPERRSGADRRDRPADRLVGNSERGLPCSV